MSRINGLHGFCSFFLSFCTHPSSFCTHSSRSSSESLADSCRWPKDTLLHAHLAQPPRSATPIRGHATCILKMVFWKHEERPKGLVEIGYAEGNPQAESSARYAQTPVPVPIPVPPLVLTRSSVLLASSSWDRHMRRLPAATGVWPRLYKGTTPWSPGVTFTYLRTILQTGPT